MGICTQKSAPWNRQLGSALHMGSDLFKRSTRLPGFKSRCLGEACRRATDAMHTVQPPTSPWMPPFCTADRRRTVPASRVHGSYRDTTAIDLRLHDLGLRCRACDAKAGAWNDLRRALRLAKNLGPRHPPKESGRSLVGNAKQYRAETTLTPTAPVQ